jgi:hypothetical protein
VRHNPRFIAVYLLAFVANLTLIGYASTLLSDEILAQAILTPPLHFCLTNLMNIFVFKKNDNGEEEQIWHYRCFNN